MLYPLFILLVSVALGLVYSLGVFAARLRYVIGEHVPMEPTLVGGLVLFIIGATLGLYLSCLALPTSYLATQQGRKLMRGLSGTHDVRWFRSACTSVVLLIVGATTLILWYAYGFVRD